MSDQVYCDIIGDDLMDERRVVDAPAGLWLAEHLLKLALCRCVLPCLPNVCGRLRVDIVGELVFELFLEWALPQLVHADLGFRLFGRWRIGRIEGLFRLLCGLLCGLLRLFRLLLLELRALPVGWVHPGGRPRHLLRIAEVGGCATVVLRLEDEE